MGSKMDLKIELDNPLLRFEPGGIISGKVVVWNKTFKPQEFKKSLGVTFVGKAWIWATASVELFFTHTVQLTAHSERRSKIGPGRNDYPFEFLLPPSLPSTFAGRFGKVEYYADVTLCRVGILDRRVTMPFNVTAIYDLNADPDASKSAKLLMEKYICCFCCKSGPIRVIFQVPIKGCIPGGYLQFSAEISNKSGSDLTRATVSLVQEANVCTQRSSEVDSKVVCRMKGPAVKAGESKIWIVDNFPVPVPSIPPTNTQSYGCLHYILIQYVLKIKVKATEIIGCIEDAKVEGSIPIVVGTVPLNDGSLSQSPTITYTSGLELDDEDEGDVYMPSPTAPPPPYPNSTVDSPPPSYLEAICSKPSPHL